MKILSILATACIGLALAGPEKQLDQNTASFEYEYRTQEVPLEEANYADPQLAASHQSADREHVGYSRGGSLVNIARGAANQAHTQLIQQHPAAGQAAYVAKNRLAQSAAQSAATAAAALAGKQIILSGLEQQSRDAHLAVTGEKAQLQQAQRAATAAQNSAQQAMHQVQVITAALNAAQATAEHAGQAASEAAAELAAQTTMVGQAKARAQAIDEQLEAARIDFQATQAAARKAASAAQHAQNNAAVAAAHAASAAAEAAAQSGHDHAKIQEEESAPISAISEESLEYKQYSY